MVNNSDKLKVHAYIVLSSLELDSQEILNDVHARVIKRYPADGGRLKWHSTVLSGPVIEADFRPQTVEKIVKAVENYDN